MIVHHVEKDHQPMVVRGVDQRLQVVGRPVGGIGRIRQHAVIAPVALTREIVDRHQFDRGDAECRQPGKLPRHTAESAEDSGMEFVQHGLAPRPSAPGGVAPRVAARIDHDAWIVHVIRLRARRGIRDQHSIRQTIAIARSVRARRDCGEPAIRRARHRQDRSVFHRHTHGLLRGRPQAKLRLSIPRGVGAEADAHSGCSAYSRTALCAATRTPSPATGRSRASGSALSSSTRPGRLRHRQSEVTWPVVWIEQQSQNRHLSFRNPHRSTQNQRPLLDIVPRLD